jgi:hypothetical protein
MRQFWTQPPKLENLPQAALNTGYVVLAIYTAVLFFGKSSKFPQFFIYQWMFISFIWSRRRDAFA